MNRPRLDDKPKCPSSGFHTGASRFTKKGRQGWCVHCGKWRALTSTGKFKRHEPVAPKAQAEA